MNELTHFNDEGRARMVDVSQKDETQRAAEARGTVYLAPETFTLVTERFPGTERARRSQQYIDEIASLNQ